MMPLSWATSSASAICRAMASASPSGSPPPFACRLDARELVRERLALDELENQEADAVRFFDAVDRADVGVIQRGEHPRLALEAREPIRIARERARQDLDRDVASELRVVRPVDLAHAAGAEQRLQLISAEGRARHRGRGEVGDAWALDAASAGSARKPSSDSDSVSSDSTSRRMRLVIGARLGEKRRALARRSGARRVVELLGPLPAFRRHASDRRASRASARPSPAASRASRSRATPSRPPPFPPRSTRRRTASR